MKPPAVRGYRWSPNGAGFDCRRFVTKAGKTTETHVAYLGKKELAKMRLQSETKDELRQLVRQWIQEKEAAKGNLLTRVRPPKQKQNHREKRGEL